MRSIFEQLSLLSFWASEHHTLSGSVWSWDIPGDNLLCRETLQLCNLLETGCLGVKPKTIHGLGMKDLLHCVLLCFHS